MHKCKVNATHSHARLTKPQKQYVATDIDKIKSRWKKTWKEKLQTVTNSKFNGWKFRIEVSTIGGAKEKGN